MRVGSFENLPNFAPSLLPLSGPHLLQAAGVQLGFVDDLDGNLEVEEDTGKGPPTQITLGCLSFAPSHRKPSIWAIPSGWGTWVSGPLHMLLPLFPVLPLLLQGNILYSTGGPGWGCSRGCESG